MRALAIDTATEMCSVALWLDDEIIERQILAANQHSNLVLGMVNEVLDEAGIGLSQLDLLINDVGPGSFTGIRIGLGVTQGLAYGADLPVVGVDALSTLAYGIKDETDDMILAAIDARMGQVYWGLFNKTGQSIKLEGQLQLDEPKNIEAAFIPVHGVGSGWDTYAETLFQQVSARSYSHECFPLARNALTLGLETSRKAWLIAADITPVYLRNNVAKVKRKNSPLGSNPSNKIRP